MPSLLHAKPQLMRARLDRHDVDRILSARRADEHSLLGKVDRRADVARYQVERRAAHWQLCAVEACEYGGACSRVGRRGGIVPSRFAAISCRARGSTAQRGVARTCTRCSNGRRTNCTVVTCVRPWRRHHRRPAASTIVCSSFVLCGQAAGIPRMKASGCPVSAASACGTGQRRAEDERERTEAAVQQGAGSREGGQCGQR